MLSLIKNSVLAECLGQGSDSYSYYCQCVLANGTSKADLCFPDYAVQTVRYSTAGLSQCSLQSEIWIWLTVLCPWCERQ